MRGMSLIVQTVARLVAGMLFLFGCYIVLHGHLTPGGGFAGGVLIAAAYILVSLAFGSVENVEQHRYTFSSVFESMGGLGFVLLGLMGYVAGLDFLNNLWADYGTPLRLVSGGIIPLANVAISMKVGAGLFGIFLALGASRFVMKD
ncbi:MAG: sodium:proton antiporter [candidate division WOR-3 bacterium]|nr:MAG: sodium:proton antiporter [candidate division WOR-3 bacterium]